MGVNRTIIEAILGCCVAEINANQGGGTIFHYAIANTDIPLKQLKILQKRGVNFNAVDDRGFSILLVAINCKRSNDCIKNLIKFGSDPNAVDPDGDTPLHLAVAKDNLELATFLVSVGSDVNAVNKDGDAPLHRTFESETLSGPLAKLLLQNGANINAKGSLGYTPAKLMVHISDVPFELMQVLKEYGADFNSTHEDPAGGCPLLYGAVHFKHSMNSIRNFVRLGADPNLTNNMGQTPLFIAVVQEYVEAAEYLISVGCDVNAADNAGYTPLHFVFDGTCNNVPMTKLLLSKGANVNAKNDRGETPLGFAALHQSSEEWSPDLFAVFEVLKENGADFNSVDNAGISPLAGCILQETSKEVLQKLVDLGADWNFVYEKQNNTTLLHIASNKLDLDAASYLLSLGIDVNKKDSNGKNALVYVFENRNYNEKSFEMIKLLLEHGTNLDSTDNDGLTFLHTLAKSDAEIDTEKVFELLKQHGADFNALDNKHRSPLDLAMVAVHNEDKSIEFITSLLDYGADPKITVTKNGTRRFTSLHLAAVLNNLELVTLLVSRGCDVNNADNLSLDTPLHALFNSPKMEIDKVYEVTEFLLANGADPNVQNARGYTVLDEVCHVDEETIELLISNGAVNADADGSMANLIGLLSSI